jgi:hypothetical protein
MAYSNTGGGYNSAGSFGASAHDTIFGQNRYNVQTGAYDPTRPDEERALALQQRAQQQELAQAIQQRALGQGGPSVAELQMQRGLGQAQQAAAQQAASARGIDRAAAFRQSQGAQAQMAAENLSNTGVLRAQEQIAAQQLGAQTNQGIRGQDIESRGISAGEQKAQLDAQIAAEKMRAEQAEENAKRKHETTGGLLTAAGGLLAMSDIRAKEDIRKLSPEEARLSAALDRIGADNVAKLQSRDNLGPVQPSTFRYKPEDAARMGTDTGLREGVMAQDLQKSPAYQAAVVPTPQGLALDKDRLLQANTAELGGLDKRMRELEDAKLMRALEEMERKKIREIQGAGKSPPKAKAAR